MSDLADTCDYFLDALTTVDGLADATTHRYAPWDPERLVNDGAHHLAVWPAGEVEAAEPFTTRGRLLRQTFRVAYWEPAGDEDERQTVDELAAAELLDLQNAVRDRFHDLTIQEPGTQVAYQATSLPEFSGPVRFFIITVNVDRGKDLI